jgi:hypothetical protein
MLGYITEKEGRMTSRVPEFKDGFEPERFEDSFGSLSTASGLRVWLRDLEYGFRCSSIAGFDSLTTASGV